MPSSEIFPACHSLTSLLYPPNVTSLATHCSETATFSVECINSHVHASGPVVSIFSPPDQTPAFLLYQAANSPLWRIHPHMFSPYQTTTGPYIHSCSNQAVAAPSAAAAYLTLAGPSLIFLIWSLYFTSSASSREIFLSMDSALLSTLRKQRLLGQYTYMRKGRRGKKSGKAVPNQGEITGKHWEAFINYTPLQRFSYSRAPFKSAWAEKNLGITGLSWHSPTIRD